MHARNSLRGKDIISMSDLSTDDIAHILITAARLEKRAQPSLLKGKILASLFFEPSTRTRLSFEAAMLRLGGTCIGFSDTQNTSIAKGETLTDTIKVISNYADVLVVRHPLDGAPARAAEASPVPVINAGDGANQHPTQTLVDLATIQKTQGRLEGLRVGILGDLRYGRTVHSLARALAPFHPELVFIAPQSLSMPEDMLEDLRTAKVHFIETENLSEHIHSLDILYATRIQKERFGDPLEYERLKSSYKLTVDDLKKAKKTLRVLHPLPRIDEVDHRIDALPQAAYFLQAKLAIYVRQAILSLILS